MDNTELLFFDTFSHDISEVSVRYNDIMSYSLDNVNNNMSFRNSIWI